jgi:hypothetical protein
VHLHEHIVTHTTKPPKGYRMAERTTARQRREAARAELSRELTRALARHDVTQLELARETGAAGSVVQRWTEPELRETPSIADLRHMPREVAVDLCRWALEPHEHIPAPTHHHETIADDLKHLSELVQDTSELCVHFSRALADGHISPDEAVRGIELAGDAIATIMSLKIRLTEALKVRGEAVRRGLVS